MPALSSPRRTESDSRHDFNPAFFNTIITKADDKVLDEIEAPVNVGGTLTLLLAPSEQKPRKLEAAFRDQDVALPVNSKELNELLGAICGYIPAKRKRFAAKSGWGEDFKTFVAQENIFGVADDEFLGMAPETHSLTARIKTAGTWENWRDLVGRPAENSSILISCVAAAFAAPLVAIVNEPSFGLCVFGDTRTGKTLGTLAAASVIGIGEILNLPGWDMTEWGFQELLPRFQHMLVPIDDLQMFEGSGRTAEMKLQKFIYKLTSGQPRRLKHHYEMETGGVPSPWHCCLLTTNEHALSKGTSGFKRQKGATIRMIDLPAILGGSDIFDLMPEDTRAGSRVAKNGELFKRLYKACEEQHGAAFKKYIEHLIERRETLAGDVERHVGQFGKRVGDAADSDMARDVARKFGLLYAGAQLAKESGVVEWTSELAFRAIAKAYRASRNLLPDNTKELREGQAKLRSFLRSLPPAHSLRGKDASETASMAGYRWRAGRTHHCLVRTERFQGIFDSVHQRKTVESRLQEDRRIELAVPRRPGSNTRVPMQQHVWLNGDRPRSMHIMWPMKRTAPRKPD